MSIEKLPVITARWSVEGRRLASEAVAPQAEAKVFEAKLRLSMGAMVSPKEAHPVGEVVDRYITDGVARLSPGSIDFYCKGTLVGVLTDHGEHHVGFVVEGADDARCRVGAGLTGGGSRMPT